MNSAFDGITGSMAVRVMASMNADMEKAALAVVETKALNRIPFWARAL
ncbi:MAG: hypothetical protein ACREOS_12955 [Candidatus Dormibacteraceae bacterium]